MIRQCLVVTCVAISGSVSAWAQTTTRASVDSSGAQSNGGCFSPSICGDGRYVAFYSYSGDLVPGDTNGTADVFVHDMLNGTTTRVSVDSNGAQGNGISLSPSISPDGRYVAFQSEATNLVPGDTNGVTDAFVHDMLSGTTTRVSVDSSGVQANGQSGAPHVSSGGRYVTFGSLASNLVLGDTNGVWDAFVYDMLSGTTTRVSVDSSGTQGTANSVSTSISSDGRFVAFWSDATNLVPGDTNGVTDTFVHDMLAGTTTRVSVDSSGAQGDTYSSIASISSDGRYVAFQSTATNLVPGDTNGYLDVFVHDRVTGATARASVSSSGAQGNFYSNGPSISADGRYVAFESIASNLVVGDTNTTIDIFVHDMLSGMTARVSVDSSGAQANFFSDFASISSDGRYVAFQSFASNLVPGDTNGADDVFVHDSGSASAFLSLCFGDGSGGTCPCSNSGSSGHGCENSAATGGALLSSSGIASLSADTVQLTCTSELPTALSIVLQGNTVIAPTNFGDGLRCAGGSLKRLYVKHAIGGSISAPQGSDPSISSRSATLGDTIPLGATRAYQVYYRDPNLGFCPAGFNASSAIAIAWGA